MQIQLITEIDNKSLERMSWILDIENIRFQVNGCHICYYGTYCRQPKRNSVTIQLHHGSNGILLINLQLCMKLMKMLYSSCIFISPCKYKLLVYSNHNCLQNIKTFPIFIFFFNLNLLTATTLYIAQREKKKNCLRKGNYVLDLILSI